MAAVSSIIAGVGLGLTGVGYVQQQEAAEDAAEAREKQARAERRKAEIQNIRAMREQIREQRIAAARITARGATSGTSGSSGVAGGVASTQSQLATNLDYMRSVATENNTISDAALDFGVAQGDAAQGAAIQGLGTTIFNTGGGFKTLFGGNQQPDIKTPGG